MKRLRNYLIAGAATLTTIVGPASPAFADTGCAANRICMWEDTNYGGDKYVDWTVSCSDPHECTYDIHWWNGDNEISSVKNTTDLYLCVYAGDETYGRHIVIAPNTNVSSLAQSYGFNDDAESFEVSPFSSSCE